MQIKTLAEILAESESDSASTAMSKTKKSNHYEFDSKNTSKANRRFIKSDDASSTSDNDDAIQTADQTSDTVSSSFFSAQSSKAPQTKSKKRQKRFHPAASFSAEPSNIPAYQPPEPQSIKEMLAEVKHKIHEDNESVEHISLKTDAKSETDTASKEADNLPLALKAYLRTPEQRQADIDAIKAESRLRWLAFYYLSRREYGKAELKQKLLDKEQNPDRIDELLDEFEIKGYQSDHRTTLMLIRESIRKGRGRGHIKQEFYRKKIDLPSNINELIDMANAESDEFSEFVDDNADSLVEGVDWLKLAVTARIKKYGDNIPTEQKDKAKQLRFLQYRGFNSDICFQALNYTLDNLDERF